MRDILIFDFHDSVLYTAIFTVRVLYADTPVNSGCLERWVVVLRFPVRQGFQDTPGGAVNAGDIHIAKVSRVGAVLRVMGNL
jgi:hypothetical protein